MLIILYLFIGTYSLFLGFQGTGVAWVLGLLSFYLLFLVCPCISGEKRKWKRKNSRVPTSGCLCLSFREWVGKSSRELYRLVSINYIVSLYWRLDDAGQWLVALDMPDLLLSHI